MREPRASKAVARLTGVARDTPMGSGALMDEGNCITFPGQLKFQVNLSLRISAVRIVAAARVLIQFRGLRLARVRRSDFILRWEVRGRPPLEIVDDRLNDRFLRRFRNGRELVGLWGTLFAHGACPFCLRF
jgi:hypothetical protein